MEAERAYLSVIEWPASLDQAAQAKALVQAAGMDAYLATMSVRRGFPQVVMRTDAATAEQAVQQLHEHGAVALACRQSELARFGEPRRIKRLQLAPNFQPPIYLCEMWREAEAPLNTAEIFLIVRATLATTHSRTTVERDSRGVARGYMLGGVPAAMVAGHAGAVRTSRTTTTEMLDLYLKNGAYLRIDADKFSFDVLGEDRQMTDRHNTDVLLQRLRREARQAIVDTGFADFHCPADIVRSHFTAAGMNSTMRTTEAPAFDFYSNWAAHMYFAMAS